MAAIHILKAALNVQGHRLAKLQNTVLCLVSGWVIDELACLDS